MSSVDFTLTVGEVFALKLAGQRYGTEEHFDGVRLFDKGYHHITSYMRKLGDEELTAICDGLVEKGVFSKDDDGYMVTGLGKDVMRQMFPHKGDGRPMFRGGY